MISRFSKIFSLLVCALTHFVFVQSVSAQYRFDVWTTDNGLPQTQVNNIHQTQDGYLWMTTFDGRRSVHENLHLASSA